MGNREAEAAAAKLGLICSSFLVARLGSIKPLFAFFGFESISKYAVCSAMVQGLRLHPWKIQDLTRNLADQEVLQQHIALLFLKESTRKR